MWQIRAAYESICRGRPPAAGLVDTGTVDDGGVVHPDATDPLWMLPGGAAVSDRAHVGHRHRRRGLSCAPLDFPENQGPVAGSRSNAPARDHRDPCSRILSRAAGGARGRQRRGANPRRLDTGKLGEVPETKPAPGTNRGPDRTGSKPAQYPPAGGGRSQWHGAISGEGFGAGDRATLYRVLFSVLFFQGLAASSGRVALSAAVNRPGSRQAFRDRG